MVEAFQLFWKNYFNIRGRTRRRHYWFAILDTTIILIILSLIFDLLSLSFGAERFFEIIYNIIDLVIFIGIFTMSVRRFHDVGRTMTIPLILFIFMLLQNIQMLIADYVDYSMDSYHTGIGLIIASVISIAISIALLILLIIAVVYCATDSQPGMNKYGPNPKGE